MLQFRCKNTFGLKSHFIRKPECQYIDNQHSQLQGLLPTMSQYEKFSSTTTASPIIRTSEESTKKSNNHRLGTNDVHQVLFTEPDGSVTGRQINIDFVDQTSKSRSNVASSLSYSSKNNTPTSFAQCMSYSRTVAVLDNDVCTEDNNNHVENDQDNVNNWFFDVDSNIVFPNNVRENDIVFKESVHNIYQTPQSVGDSPQDTINIQNKFAQCLQNVSLDNNEMMSLDLFLLLKVSNAPIILFDRIVK